MGAAVLLWMGKLPTLESRVTVVDPRISSEEPIRWPHYLNANAVLKRLQVCPAHGIGRKEIPEDNLSPFRHDHCP